jgi:diadenosine tetraphosphatase ApaH/serine/threonine PP2A family protein phosphatase
MKQRSGFLVPSQKVSSLYPMGDAEALEISPVASRVLDAYKQLISLGSDNVEEIGVKIPIPSFREITLLALCDAAIHTFVHQPLHLELTGEFYIIGDLHGNLIDLLRVLYQMHRPPFSQIIFLGDFVDRGPFSLEVITLVLAFACCYPDSVYIIRGNHEFGSVNRVYGFFDEIMSVYQSETLWARFQDVFAWMPLTALVNRRVFCVHGGISQRALHLKDMSHLQRPIYEFEDPLIADLVWSDPSMFHPLFAVSRRGVGFEFGVEAITNFLKANHLIRVVRAHQFCKGGIEDYLNGNITTVFSTSTGADNGRNLIGLLKLTEANEFKQTILYPGPSILRSEAQFKEEVAVQRLRKGDGTKALTSSSQNLVKNGLMLARRSTDVKRKKGLSPTRSLTLDHLQSSSLRLKIMSDETHSADSPLDD